MKNTSELKQVATWFCHISGIEITPDELWDWTLQQTGGDEEDAKDLIVSSFYSRQSLTLLHSKYVEAVHG